MSRASTPRGDVAREKILQHAVQIFSQRGFDGFTTRELSARAKVNIAAINYYFGHKQGLYEAAVEDVHRRLKERANQIFTTEVAPRLFGPLLGGQSGDGAAGSSTKMATLDLDQLRLIVARIYQAGRQESAGVRLLLRQVLDGGQSVAELEAHPLPGTELAAGMLSSMFGLPPTRARANVVAFNLLLGRYLVSDDRSLLAAFAVDSQEVVERCVVDTLLGTLSGRA